MKLKPNRAPRRSVRSLALAALVWAACPALVPPLEAQTIEVVSADPQSAEQGTVNLDVTIKGNGFAKGSTAHFLVSGTTNPGGVTVNSTQVRGSKTVIANIDIADDAVIAAFDIEVRQNGRSGKGTELFQVLEKFSGPARSADIPVCVSFEDDPALYAIRSDGYDADGDGNAEPYCLSKKDKVYAHIGRSYGQFRLITNTSNKVSGGRTNFIDFSGCVDASCDPPFVAGLPESTDWNTSRDLDLYLMPEGSSATVAMRVAFYLLNPGTEDRWEIGFGDKHPPNAVDCADAATNPGEADPVLVTRVDAETWTIEGSVTDVACLDTVDFNGAIVSHGHFTFPFRLTITIQ